MKNDRPTRAKSEQTRRIWKSRGSRSVQGARFLIFDGENEIKIPGRDHDHNEDDEDGDEDESELVSTGIYADENNWLDGEQHALQDVLRQLQAG